MSEKKTKRKFSKFLKGFDYFGVEMKFSIDQEETHRSKLGGLVFLIYFLISLTYVCYNFYQFAWRNSQTLSFSSKVLSPAPPIYLNTTNLTFSTGVVFNDNYTSAVESYSKYLEYNIDYSGYSAETDKSMYIELPTGLCNRSNFQSISDKIFNVNFLNKTICPTISGNQYSNLVIQGDFTDTKQSFMIIKVSLKDEILNDSKLYAEFKKFLNENPIIVQLYLIDTKVDYEEYSDFLGNYLTVTNSYASLNQVKFYEISLSKLIFKSDNNILWQNPDEHTSIMLSKSDYNSYSIEDRDKINVAERKVLNQFFIKSSPKAYYYERNYQKLSDFLANMTGIVSQAVLIIIAIMSHLNDKAARRKIMKKVMKFKSGEKNNSNIFSKFLKKDFVQTNQIENLNYFNCSNKLNKNEDKISKNDIEIEIERSPVTQKALDEDLRTPNSLHTEKDASNEERYSKYVCHTENLPLNILKSNDDLQTCQFKNTNIHENNEVNISANNLNNFQPDSLQKNYPDKKNLSLNKGIFYTNVARREMPDNQMEEVKLSPSPYRQYSSCNQNTERSKISNEDKNREFITKNVKSNNRKNSFSEDSKNIQGRSLKPINDETSNIKNNPVNVSLCQKIKSSICCQKKSRKIILLNMAGEKLHYYMDVISYIKMKEEFNTLKEILFNENQIHLFDFLSRPIIEDRVAKFIENKKNGKINMFSKVHDKEIEGVFEYYEKARSQELKNDENNQRLFKMIEEQIKTMNS